MAAGAARRHDEGMTQQPPPSAPPAPRPRSGLDGLFDWVRGLGLARDTDNRWFGGVCSGLGRRFGIDPILVRALTVILALIGGVGLTLYVLAWLFLPDPQGRIHAEGALREGDAWGIVLIAVFAVLVITGISVGHSGPRWFVWWLVPLAVIGVIVIRSADRRSATPPPPGGPTVPPLPYAAPPAPGGPAPAGTGTGGPTGPATDATGYGAPTHATAGYGAPTYTGPGYTGPGYTAPTPAQRYQAPPTWSPRPPVAPVAPPPPRPRRRPAGGSAALVAIGLVIAGYGIGYLLDGPTGFPGSAELLGAAVALGAVSVLVLALGIMGRRGGFATFLAIVLAFGTWVATVSPSTAFTHDGGVGDRQWAPAATVTSATYSIGLGDGTLDLTGLADPAAVPPGVSGTTPDLTVNVGLGDLRIIVPEGVTATVSYDLGYGSVHVVGPDGSTAGSRPSSQSVSASTTVGTGPRAVDITAHLGLGDLTIERM